MPIPNQNDTVESGHTIIIDVFYTDQIRRRAIRIGRKGESNADAVPPVHDENFDFVRPFMGKERGKVAIIPGCRADQESEYKTVLIDILSPNDLVQADQVDVGRPYTTEIAAAPCVG